MLSIHLPQVPQLLDNTCGAACFDSMYQLFFGASLGEKFFAEKLGIHEIGYTPAERIVELAQSFNINAELKRNCTPNELIYASKQSTIVFVTWWFEDAGHYSLIRTLANGVITMMDPWQARESRDTLMPLTEFIPLWQMRGATMIIVTGLGAAVSTY